MQRLTWDENKLKREVTVKSVIFGVLLAALIAVLIVLLNLRMQFLTSALTVLLGSVYVFFLYVFWVPPVKYLRYHREMARGQRRVSEVVFDRYEEDRVVREGLWFYPFVTHDETEDAFERVFYWDAEIEKTPFEAGTRMKVESYGQVITGLEIL